MEPKCFIDPVNHLQYTSTIIVLYITVTKTKTHQVLEPLLKAETTGMTLLVLKDDEIS